MSGIVSVDASAVPAVLKTIETKAKNLDKILPVVAQILVAAVDDVYDAEGPGWEPLASASFEHRRGKSAKLLQDTGVMAASTTGVVGSDYAEARAGVAYARYHASGTKHMPKRNPFDLGPFEDGVMKEVSDLLAKEVTQ